MAYYGIENFDVFMLHIKRLYFNTAKIKCNNNVLMRRNSWKLKVFNPNQKGS